MKYFKATLTEIINPSYKILQKTCCIKKMNHHIKAITQTGKRKFTGSPVASDGIHSHQRLQLPERDAGGSSLHQGQWRVSAMMPNPLVKLPEHFSDKQTRRVSCAVNQPIQAMKLIKMAPTPLYLWFCPIKNSFLLFLQTVFKQIRFVIKSKYSKCIL